MRRIAAALAGLAVLGAVACSDSPNVENKNNLDRTGALARPVDVENLIVSSFNSEHAAVFHSTEAIGPGLYVLGMLNYSNLANFNMGVRAAIPRPPINNSRGNNGQDQNNLEWRQLHRAARSAATGLAEVKKSSFNFLPPQVGRNLRSIAFANFVIGISLGQIAMAYDSGIVISEIDNLSAGAAPQPLVYHDSLARYSLARLDTAIAIANSAAASGAGGFPLPNNWLNTSGTVPAAQFVALARAWKARIAINVLRTPAEAAALTAAQWTAIRDDALAGAAGWPRTVSLTVTAGAVTNVNVTADGHTMSFNPSNGWNMAWISQMFASSSQNWHQVWPYMWGFADTSGAYAGWLATKPDANKLPFLIVSPDRRLPVGTTRALQQADAREGARLYLRNRATGLDWTGEPLGTGFYDYYRFLAFQNAGRIGPFSTFTNAEMNLMAAEADIMLGQFAAASGLIDITRADSLRGKLPPITAMNITTLAQQIGPSATACVPKIPAGPTFTTTVCGNIMEAMKWEKRLETAFTSWGSWYFDGRRWGDLPEGTPVEYPVPFQEMDVRLQAFYPIGGQGQPGGAPKGNYGI